MFSTVSVESPGRDGVAAPAVTPLCAGAAAVLVMLGLGASPGQAQTSTMPEVVVSASRVAVPTEQVGSSVTIITEDDLTKRQSLLVSDVLREVPGVSVSRSGGTGALTQVRIRGAEANQTLVLIDGVEANDPAFGSEFDFSNLLAADVERVEVLRGNQSALWGSDAIGGVISITTKRGRKGLTATGKAEGGSFGLVAGGGTIRGGTERASFAFNGNYLRQDGINVTRPSIVRDIQQSQGENDGYRNLTLSGNAQLQPWDPLEISLVGRLVNVRTETDPQDFSTSGAPLFTPSPTQGFVVDGDEVTFSDQFFGRAEGKLTLLDGMWEHKAGAALTDTDNDIFQNRAQVTGTAGRKFKLDYQTNLFLSTPDVAEAEHTFTAAVEREDESFQQRAAPSAFGDPNQDQRLINRGVIGEYRLAAWDRVFVSGGLRHDFNDRFKNKTTYRATGAYLHQETQTRLHGSYGTGVKNPTFTELFGFFPGRFLPNPGLQPEESRGWDIGIEQSFFDGDVVVDLTHFRQRLENEIVTRFPAPTFIGTPVNVDGISKQRGIEVAAQAKITDDLSANATYSYVRATQPEQTPSPKIRLEVRRPRHIASFNATYRFDEDRGRVNLGVQYNGPTEDLEFNGNTPRDRVTLKGFALVNMAVSYRLNDYVELFGRIENLLNQDYEEVYSFSTPGIGGFGGLRVNLDLLTAWNGMQR